MKNWLEEIQYDDRLDYCLEPDDNYVNKGVESVIMPYDLMLARSRWEKRNKVKKSKLMETFY